MNKIIMHSFFLAIVASSSLHAMEGGANATESSLEEIVAEYKKLDVYNNNDTQLIEDCQQGELKFFCTAELNAHNPVSILRARAYKRVKANEESSEYLNDSASCALDFLTTHPVILLHTKKSPLSPLIVGHLFILTLNRDVPTSLENSEKRIQAEPHILQSLRSRNSPIYTHIAAYMEQLANRLRITEAAVVTQRGLSIPSFIETEYSCCYSRYLKRVWPKVYSAKSEKE